MQNIGNLDKIEDYKICNLCNLIRIKETDPSLTIGWRRQLVLFVWLHLYASGKI